MGIAPEAIYEARCTAIGIESTMKGDDYISADFEIVDDNGEAYKVEWRGWLTEKTERKTMEALRLLGWQGDDIYEDMAAEGALRNKVKLDVRHEEYKGKKTARVSFINGPDPDPVATEKKREERRARMRRVAGIVKPIPLGEDDDIGF
jgi:hypothetical protein